MKTTENGPSTEAETVPRVLTGGTPYGEASVGNRLTDELVKAIPEVTEILNTGIAAFNGIPEYGAYRTADHQYYFNRKGPVPSVTGILKVLSKDALVQWGKRTVAEFAVETFLNGKLAESMEQGPEQTKRWLAALPDYVRDSSAQLGTSVHLLADIVSRSPAGVTDAFSEGFQVSEQEKPYLAAFLDFMQFLELHSGTIISSEKMVWSEEGYAGTYDLLIRFLCQCHRGLWLIDVKTSKGYYPEYALQLAGYGHADSIIVEGSPNPFPMPQIQNYGVLHLRPDLYTETDTVAKGWRLVQYPVTDRDYLAFLACLEIHKWKAEGRFSKKLLKAVTEGEVDRVIQDPLTTEATVPE